MVSQSEHVPVTSPTGTSVTDDRGIRQQTSYPAYQSEGVGALQYRSFWGAVIAGSLVAIAFIVLSLSLMFGCGVGIYTPAGSASSALALSWGSAIWMIITAALALLLGGYVSSAMSRPLSHGWLYGLAVWGLTVPLFFIIAAIIADGIGAVATTTAGAVGGQAFATVGIAAGVPWVLFCSLICAAVLGMIGGVMGSAGSADSRR